MALTLADLLAARPFDLTLRTSAPTNSPALTWAAVTELEDPRRFLSGGELVLSTGLKLRTTTQQRDFVSHLTEAGVVALGFGVGLAHDKVPTAILAAAEEAGLPVVEVPYETPFIAIGKAVADALSATHVARMERLFREHHALAETLLAGKGLEGFLKEFARLVGTDVVLRQYGVAIGHSGERPPHDPTQDAASWETMPVPTGMKDRCTISMAKPFEPNPIIDYAQSLIGLELANRARILRSRRIAVGHVLEDLFKGYLDETEASARLATIGVEASARYSVVLLQVASGQRTGLARMSLPSELGDLVSGVAQDRLLVLVPERFDVDRVAEQIRDYIYGAGLTGTLGIGGTYAGARGLNRSYLEALDALRGGETINRTDRLTLTSLLLVNDDAPMRNLASETLAPLLDFDDHNGAELVKTLRVYLELNGSIGAVSSTLGLHRNSVRYRLTQITELTGFNPAVTADRVHLYLALASRDL